MSKSAQMRWKVSEHGSSFLVGEDREGGRLIAELPTGYCDQAFKAQQRTNAALIASIPDLQARIAELEHQAAIGRRAFDAAQVADAVESLVGWVGRNMDCGCTPLELVKARALIKILRDAEQAGVES